MKKVTNLNRILLLASVLAVIFSFVSCSIGQGNSESDNITTEMTEKNTDQTNETTEVPEESTAKETDEHIHDYSITVSYIAPTLLKKGSLSEGCECGDTRERELDIVDPLTLDIPVVYITDEKNAEIPLVKLEKADGEIKVKFQYVSNNDAIEDFEGYCKIKIQGASSSAYRKKNFTIKLFKDEELSSKLKVDLGWGKENKYCMKANYIDTTHSRNIIGARLFAQVVQTRNNITEGLLSAPNYGLIDGYPTLVYINGSFHGIYTMNIPKDIWTFAMEGEEESREALLMADDWTESVCLRQEIGDGDFEDYGFEVEHSSTEDEQWIKDSFNALISILNCGDEARIISELPKHLDIEAAIDNLLFTYYISAADNLSKNILWATYDGKIWIPSMYDMDGSFGINASGEKLIEDGTNSWFSTPTLFKLEADGSVTLHGEHGNQLAEILFKYYGDKLEARWWELRENVLSDENVESIILEFVESIPSVAQGTEKVKWLRGFSKDQSVQGMIDYTKRHAADLDEFFKSFN